MTDQHTVVNAREYIQDVLSGRQLVCRYVRQAVERHARDLARSADADYPYRFDERKAIRSIHFAQLLKHSKGKWAKRNEYLRLEGWQQFIKWCVHGWVRKDTGTRRFRKVYIEVSRKNGKALDVDTMIPTPSGWTTMGELQVGDIIFDDLGKRCTVTFATDTMHGHDCYEVRFSDGTSIIADAGHLWETSPRSTGRSRSQKKESWGKRSFLYTTEQIRNTLHAHPDSQRVEWNHKVKLALPLDIPSRDLVVPPYVLGAWLGDGHSNGARFTSPYRDIEIIHEIRREGVTAEERNSFGKAPLYILGRGHLQAQLRELGVLNNKHIPPAYLRASQDQRLSLLQGLMDTDGYCSKTGQCEFSTIRKHLCGDVCELLATLGIKYGVLEQPARLNGRTCGTCYRILFFAFSDMPVFRLRRKRERQKPVPKSKTRTSSRQIVAVEKVESVPVRCIQVDSPNHLFLAGHGMVPTHNTTLAATEALDLFFLDGEEGAEIYMAATKRDQAKVCWTEVMSMVTKQSSLRERVDILMNTSTIRRRGQLSVIKALGADSDTEDGLNPLMGIIDEYHAHKTADMVNVLESGMGARTQPLIEIITTAGTNQNGPCYQEERALAVNTLAGQGPEDYFCIIFTLDEGDDWTDPDVWIKANPNLGVSVFEDHLASRVEMALASPRKQNDVKTKNFNIWCSAATVWITPEVWDACGGPVDMEALRGRRCFAAFDLANSVDMSAVALVFPPKDLETDFQLHVRYYMPKDTLRARSLEDHVPYEMWVEQGWITATPGNIIDQDFIERDLRAIYDVYGCEATAYDPWNASQMVTHLKADGMVLVEMRQGYATMSPLSKFFETVLLSRRLRHGMNPVLAWNIACTAVEQDAAENIKPVKPDRKTGKRIDGVVAAIMALGLAMRDAGEGQDDGAVRVVG